MTWRCPEKDTRKILKNIFEAYPHKKNFVVAKDLFLRLQKVMYRKFTEHEKQWGVLYQGRLIKHDKMLG